MSPDSADEQPRLIQENRNQGMFLAVPREENTGLVANQSSDSNPRKHEHPEELQSEGTPKRTKLSSDNETPTLTENHQKLEAQYEEHNVTGIHLLIADVKQAVSNAGQDPAAEIENLKSTIEKLNTKLISQENQLWDKDLEFEFQREEHEATKIDLSELQGQVDISIDRLKIQSEELRAKNQIIRVNLGNLGNVQREVVEVRECLQQTKKRHDSAKKQICDFQNELAKVQEKLNTRDRELEDSKRMLEEVDRDAECLRRVNDQNGARNTKIQDSADRAKAKLDKERKDHRITEARLNEEKVKIAEDYKALRKEYKTKQSDWNKQTAKMVTELRELRGKNQRYSNKIPDEKVKEVLSELRFKITQFIDTYLEQIPKGVDQKLEPVWDDFTPNARKFLESYVFYNLIFESYIWEWLRHTVFAADSRVWAGNLGTSFSQVLNMAQEQIKGPQDNQKIYADGQYWRSSSNNFLARLTERSYNSEYCHPDVKSMILNLSKLCGSFDVDKATTDALEIFNNARELDIMLRTLKAEFSLSWASGKFGSSNHSTPRFGFSFTDSAMAHAIHMPNNEGGAQAPAVDFIVCPALYKRGNNDGADYQTVNCCIKMLVVCNASRFGVPQVQVGSLGAVQEIKVEDTDNAVTYMHSQSRFTPVGSEPGRKKTKTSVLQRDIPVKSWAEKPTSGSTPGKESETAIGVDVRTKSGSSNGRRTQKRKTFSGSDGDDDPDDGDYDPRGSGFAKFCK